jgi:hypothetical protein
MACAGQTRGAGNMEGTMFGFNRRRSKSAKVTPPEQPQQVAQESNQPLTERERLLRQQYERLANRQAMTEAEDQARHQQEDLH